MRSQSDPRVEDEKRTEEELYRVELLWSFHRRLRQRESVTGTERSTGGGQEGAERGRNTEKDRRTGTNIDRETETKAGMDRRGGG